MLSSFNHEKFSKSVNPFTAFDGQKRMDETYHASLGYQYAMNIALFHISFSGK